MRMQLTLLMLGMQGPMLLAPKKGQAAPVLLLLAPACPPPPVAEWAQWRKQVWMPLVHVSTQQGALQVLLPACPQLSALPCALRGAQAMMLQAPACTLMLQSMAPVSLEERAAWQKGVAAVRLSLMHRPVVLSGLLRGPLQALELQLVTRRVRHDSKVCWSTLGHCTVV